MIWSRADRSTSKCSSMASGWWLDAGLPSWPVVGTDAAAGRAFHRAFTMARTRASASLRAIPHTVMNAPKEYSRSCSKAERGTSVAILSTLPGHVTGRVSEEALFVFAILACPNQPKCHLSLHFTSTRTETVRRRDDPALPRPTRGEQVPDPSRRCSAVQWRCRWA